MFHNNNVIYKKKKKKKKKNEKAELVENLPPSVTYPRYICIICIHFYQGKKRKYLI